MDDLISRQAAIDATWFEPSYTDPLNVLTEVRDRLKVLPSANKSGRWVMNPSEVAGDGYYVCSNCNNDVYDATDFCPNCGADMRPKGDDDV